MRSACVNAAYRNTRQARKAPVPQASRSSTGLCVQLRPASSSHATAVVVTVAVGNLAENLGET